MRYKCFIFFFAIHCSLFSQITLEPSLYSSMGASSSFQGWHMDYSAGEPVIQTASTGGLTFTQGFHQPVDSFYIFNSPLQVSYAVDSTCRGKLTGSILLSATGGIPPYSYIWDDYTLDSVTFFRQALDTGTYNVIIIDAENTSVLKKIVVYETENCLKVYTGITPNGDGANDNWYIGNIDFYPENQVTLYSRWGNKVWETKYYDNTSNYWTGTDNGGNRLPDGTYFYVIQNAGPKTYKGWVELTGEIR